MAIVTIACGGKEKTHFNNKKNINYTKDETVYEYKWFQSLSDYEGKKIAVYGFIWMDTLTAFLPNGPYTVYERPNCYKCGEVKVMANTDISMVVMDDTTIINISTSGQWRLVKIVGTVEGYNTTNIERIELSEYSYPDYEDSGFKPLTQDLFDGHKDGKEAVYLDGKFKIGQHVLSDDYLAVDIVNTRLKSKIRALVKSGNQPNNIEKGKYLNGQLIIRDGDGKFIDGEKIRVYGQLVNFDNNNNAEKLIYVEVIKRIK